MGGDLGEATWGGEWTFPVVIYGVYKIVVCGIVVYGVNIYRILLHTANNIQAHRWDGKEFMKSLRDCLRLFLTSSVEISFPYRIYRLVRQRCETKATETGNGAFFCSQWQLSTQSPNRSSQSDISMTIQNLSANIFVDVLLIKFHLNDYR